MRGLAAMRREVGQDLLDLIRLSVNYHAGLWQGSRASDAGADDDSIQRSTRH